MFVWFCSGAMVDDEVPAGHRSFENQVSMVGFFLRNPDMVANCRQVQSGCEHTMGGQYQRIVCSTSLI